MPTSATDAPEKLTLVTRAKKIIAGEIPPEPLPMHENVRRFVEESRDIEAVALRQGSESSRREIINYMNLEAYYRGQTVVHFTTKEGVLTVLAVGEEEIRELYVGLTPAEMKKAVSDFP